MPTNNEPGRLEIAAGFVSTILEIQVGFGRGIISDTNEIASPDDCGKLALKYADALIAAHNATRGDVQAGQDEAVRKPYRDAIAELTTRKETPAPVANEGGWIVGVPTAEMYPNQIYFEGTVETIEGKRYIQTLLIKADDTIYPSWTSTWVRILAHRSAAPYAGPVGGEVEGG